jgi:hypothetical protein
MNTYLFLLVSCSLTIAIPLLRLLATSSLSRSEDMTFSIFAFVPLAVFAQHAFLAARLLAARLRGIAGPARTAMPLSALALPAFAGAYGLGAALLSSLGLFSKYLIYAEASVLVALAFHAHEVAHGTTGADPELLPLEAPAK